MAASKDDISGWFDRGITAGATHMIVVCDTFAYEDYPVFVSAGQSVRDKADTYRASSMLRVMEIYNLSDDKAWQMGERRVFHWD